MATSDTVGAITSLKITGASTYFDAKILSVDFTQSKVAINRTPLDRTSGGMTYDVGRLTSWTMSGTMIYDPGDTVPLGTKGQVVLKFADSPTSSLTWSTGFLTSLSTPITLEEGIEASFEMTLCGDAS